MDPLLAIAPQLEPVIAEIGFLAHHYSRFHPGNSGNISCVLGSEVSDAVLSFVAKPRNNWIPLTELASLSELRRDGREGYRAEGITGSDFFAVSKLLGRRLMLITRTGAHLPSISYFVDRGEPSRLFSILEINDEGTAIRLVYGNEQYGSIPSIETHIHIASCAYSVKEGCLSPSCVHTHPPYLLRLSRHPKIWGNPKRLNALLYTQIEGINRHDERLVGVVPYEVSGTQRLVEASLYAIRSHHLVLWQNHGFLVRSPDVRRAYTLTSYAEESAFAALDTLDRNMVGLPLEFVRDFLETHGLLEVYQELLSD